MCTVTYLPFRAGFVLTHNRDEAPARNAPTILREKMPSGATLLFPRDAKAGGTWIAAARSGKVACLLNGAFEKHRHEPPYRRSRGLMLLDFFERPAPEDFFENYDFGGIEPFTFLSFAVGQAAELRWDGAQKHLRLLAANEPHFWCSATLYPAEMRQRREQVFRDWWQKQSDLPQKWPAAAMRLHQTGSVGDPENDFVMNRAERVRTVSITQVLCGNGRFRMRYQDLLSGQVENKNMAFAAPADLQTG